MSVRDCVLQVFELNEGKAWGAVLTSIVSFAASLYIISISPWYLLPFAWALAGTAFTGVSSIVQYASGRSQLLSQCRAPKRVPRLSEIPPRDCVCPAVVRRGPRLRPPQLQQE